MSVAHRSALVTRRGRVADVDRLGGRCGLHMGDLPERGARWASAAQSRGGSAVAGTKLSVRSPGRVAGGGALREIASQERSTSLVDPAYSLAL